MILTAMVKKEVLILVDYKDQFWGSARRKEKTINLEVFQQALRKRGFSPAVLNFSQIDLRRRNFNGCLIFYTSQEDADLRYKSFIEDVLIGLQIQGAILVPDIKFLRAHHNKVFMEILRDVLPIGELKNVNAQKFGAYEEFLKFGASIRLPSVVKPSAGAMSRGVAKIDAASAKRKIRAVSRSVVLDDIVKNAIKYLMGIRSTRRSIYRNKFVLQDFIEGLTHDFKILVFGSKLFVLRRQVRSADFRASGSGKFAWPRELPVGLLDMAHRVATQLIVPCVSLDIAEKEGKFFVLEFQAIIFGGYTLEFSPHHFRADENGWKLVEGGADLEDSLAEAYHTFIENVLRNKQDQHVGSG